MPSTENASSILTQKFWLFYGRIQPSPETADNVILAAGVLHSYLRNDLSVEDYVIENTDAPSQPLTSRHIAVLEEVLLKKPRV